MNRRKFAFWIGASLFGLSEKLRAESLDTLAAATMWCTEEISDSKPRVDQVRWKYQENGSWRWFDRETLVDDQWKLTGRTTPVNRFSGEPYAGETGYLDEDLVPNSVRFGDEKIDHSQHWDIEDTNEEDTNEEETGEASALRRSRNGRPPSKWLRSLHSEELRLWLPKIDEPTAGVSGMTVWTHLTRDHGFNAKLIDGLTDQELATLHAAAHFGY